MSEKVKVVTITNSMFRAFIEDSIELARLRTKEAIREFERVTGESYYKLGSSDE